MRLKIHEILKVVENEPRKFNLQNATRVYPSKTLRIFLSHCNSANNAAKILFGKDEYYNLILSNAKGVAKLANETMENEIKYLSKNEDTKVLYDTILLKYFPIEWLEKHIVINSENRIFCYNHNKNEYYVSTFDPSRHSNISILGRNLFVIQKAVDDTQIKDLYSVCINQW